MCSLSDFRGTSMPQPPNQATAASHYGQPNQASSASHYGQAGGNYGQDPNGQMAAWAAYNAYYQAQGNPQYGSWQ